MTRVVVAGLWKSGNKISKCRLTSWNSIVIPEVANWQWMCRLQYASLALGSDNDRGNDNEQR